MRQERAEFLGLRRCSERDIDCTNPKKAGLAPGLNGVFLIDVLTTTVNGC